MSTNKTRDLTLCALFVALICVGTFIRIPGPVVPITLQTLFTMLAGLLLGGRLGSASVAVYVAMGLLGLPVFAEGGGPSYILRPSFGYLLGFIAGTYLTGKIANSIPSPGFKRLVCANFAGMIVIYFCGMTYYYLLSELYLGVSLSLKALFLYCCALTAPGDVILCVLAAFLGRRLIPLISIRP